MTVIHCRQIISAEYMLVVLLLYRLENIFTVKCIANELQSAKFMSNQVIPTVTI